MEPSSEQLLSEWDTFFTEISRFVSSVNRQRGLANEQFCEHAVERLEMFLVSISSLITHIRANLPSGERSSEIAMSHMCTELSNLLKCLRDILAEWEDYLNHPSGGGAYSYSVPVHVSIQPGRPRFDISKQQLIYLRSMCFSWVQIANLLGVSRMTVFRRRREYGLTETESNSVLSDDELQLIIRQIKNTFPSLGQTMVWGRLRSMGYRVTRERVREAVRTTDPINTALRWREASSRRTYSVPGPNSLWHIGTSIYNVYTAP